MSIVPWPSGARVRKIEWTLDQPAQVNRSEWTGKRQITILSQAPRWRAKVELAPIIGEPAIRRWRLFLASLQGPVNSFALALTEVAQTSAGPTFATVRGAGQTGKSLNIQGLAANSIVLRAGQMIHVADTSVWQVAVVATDIVADASGFATIATAMPLRASPANGAGVELQSPKALVSLTGTSAGWSVDPGQLYGVSFEAEEA